MSAAGKPVYAGQGLTWPDYLHHRARLLRMWRADGKSPEKICDDIRMDPGQVRLIQATVDARPEMYEPDDGGPRERSLEADVAVLAAERDRLRAQVDDLQSGMFINCVYCGHRYGPRETTAAVIPGATPTMAQALAAHVATCPKHPLAKARELLSRWLTVWRPVTKKISTTVDMDTVDFLKGLAAPAEGDPSMPPPDVIEAPPSEPSAVVDMMAVLKEALAKKSGAR